MLGGGEEGAGQGAPPELLGCGPDPERESSARSALASSPQQAPHAPAMEFPDLGAHCSEQSCQRLGEGRSAWGAGPGGRGRGLQVGRAGWALELARPGGRGSKLGAEAWGRGQRDGELWKGCSVLQIGRSFSYQSSSL